MTAVQHLSAMVATSRNNVQTLGQGERVVVLAHGFGTDQSSWAAVTKAFVHDCKVVLFDHVGFGRSDRLAYCLDRHDSLRGYALDAIDVLDRLESRNVTFVGHSIGGVIGMLASIERPDLFERLVLLNPSARFIAEPPEYPIGFARRKVVELLELMDRDYSAWADLLAPAAIGRGNDPFLIRAFGQGLHSLDPMITRRFARLVFHVDVRAQLPRVTTSTSILHCTGDEFAPMEMGEYVHRNLPNATLTHLDATGHCPHMTRPDLVVAALRTQLEVR